MGFADAANGKVKSLLMMMMILLLLALHSIGKCETNVVGDSGDVLIPTTSFWRLRLACIFE
jgi:hypothetical protein